MKHPYLAKRHWKTELSENEKAGRLQFDGPVINLTIGDPDMNTHPLIIEAAFADAKAGHTHYTNSFGDPELRAELCSFYKKQYGMELDKDEVFICAAGNVGMYLVMQVILDPGDEVLVAAPCFGEYLPQVELAGGVPVIVETFEEDNFQLSIERMEAAVTPRTKAILFNTPCNPTGVCYTMEGLRGIADVAKRHDLIVVADDIYTDFSFETPFVPIASLPDMFPRSITVNSFSKNYTMTGWRVGNIVGPREILDVLAQLNGSVVFTAPSISQRAALYALRNRDQIVPPVIAEYRRRLDYAAGRINAIPGLSVLKPQGTLYLFPNIKGSGMTSAEVVAKWAGVGVLVMPGTGFGGACGEGYVRISCTVGVDQLKEAFDRIESLPEFGGK